jgi:glycogen operon protein
MLLAGDEMGRSQGGNNNAWCQDNEVSWLNWNDLEEHRDKFEFFRNLITFRQSHALLRPRHFEGEENGERRLTWHGRELNRPDWSDKSHSLGMHLQGRPGEAEIYLIAHAGKSDADFKLPGPHGRPAWRRFVDTALSNEQASTVPGQETVLENLESYRVRKNSVVVLVR